MARVREEEAPREEKGLDRFFFFDKERVACYRLPHGGAFLAQGDPNP